MSFSSIASVRVITVPLGASASPADIDDVDPQEEIERAQSAVQEAKERVIDDAKRLRDIAQVRIPQNPIFLSST